MIVLLILITFCAVQAIRATRLLNATLWLAGVSALAAMLFYFIGAWQIAAIELSVGTGLVTVLMVFAITMIGNEIESMTTRSLPLMLVVATTLLLLILTVPFTPQTGIADAQPVDAVLWQERGLDLLPQIALIFAGVLGVLGLLREDDKTAQHHLGTTENLNIGSQLPEAEAEVEREAA